MSEMAAGASRKDRPKTHRTRIGRPFPPKNAGKPRGTRDRRTLVGVEVCQAMAAHAADRLARLIDSKSTRIAFEASRLCLAYAWGQPRAILELGGDFGDLAAELAAALKAAREHRALNGGTASPAAPLSGDRVLVRAELLAAEVVPPESTSQAGDNPQLSEVRNELADPAPEPAS